MAAVYMTRQAVAGGVADVGVRDIDGIFPHDMFSQMISSHMLLSHMISSLMIFSHMLLSHMISSHMLLSHMMSSHLGIETTVASVAEKKIA